MSEVTSIELIPTYPFSTGRYERITWVEDLDKLRVIEMAKRLLMKHESEEGIIIIKKVKYNE